MTTISDFLKIERELLLPIVQKFMTEQKEKYARLSSELAVMLGDIEPYLLRGGKWHRAALGSLSYRISGGNQGLPYRQGIVASEIMHRFLLVHDDILDRDLFRHNGPTLEKVNQDRFKQKYPTAIDDMYSKGAAMVDGDLIFSFVYELITSSGFSAEITNAAVRAFNRLTIETVAGWRIQTEQNFMKIGDVTEEAFFNGMQLVSAQYSIVWPLRMGQIFAGRLSEDLWDKNLETYGWHTGAAFQIMDDILGMFGEPEETGKPVGHDYREGKKTFLVLYAYQAGSQEVRKFMEQTLGTEIDEATLCRVQSIMKETGALDRVKVKALDHATKAKEALAMVESKDQEAVQLLEQLADLMANRKY